VVTVTERPILRSLDFKGLKRLSRTDITERITKESISVREGSPISLGEVKRLQTTIEEMYREKGFRFAKAEYLLEEVAPTERRVVFSIDEAEKVRIGDIKFADNKVYGDWRLKWAMSKTKESNLLWRVLKRDIYNPATIAEDLVKVKDLYRGAGYKNVLLEDPVLGVKEKKSGKRSLKIEIPVVEGSRFKLGEIKIEGNQVFNQSFLAAQYSRPRGGWLRSSMVTKGTEAVQDAYKNYGHIFANIDLQLVEREDDVADIEIKITEGDQYRVGRMEFEGNTRTRDKVLRREFRIQEGTLLNMGAIKGSLFKVNQLGYFKLNETDPITFENFDTEKKTVDVKVKGDESDRTELQVGAGWSETYGFFGQLSVRTQNFLGRGETVGLSFQSGRYQDEYGLSYYIPWWLDRPQSVGLQLFKSNLNYSQTTLQQSERQSQGAVLTYGRNFGLFGSASVSYTLSQSKDRLFYTGPRRCHRRAELRHRQLVDPADLHLRQPRQPARDDARLEPRRFARVRRRLPRRRQLLLAPRGPPVALPAPDLLAGQDAGWRSTSRPDQVIPFDGREVVPLERYFIGGENSVRGFQFRSIYVRDEDTNLPVLQDGYYKGGRQVPADERRAPGPGGRTVPGHRCSPTEATSTTTTRVSTPPACATSAGGELRIFVPIFGAPLRFIYASNLDPIERNDAIGEPGDRFESFQFSIGATF
jgi:outer membrane protein insertion porin family